MNFAYYHYADSSNEPVGPVSAEQLHALVRSGSLSPETHVWKEGASDWHPYHSMFPPPVVRRPAAMPLQPGMSSSQPQNPWYKRTGWSIVLLHFFPYVMLPLMWVWKLYTLRARIYITAAYAGVALFIVAIGVSSEIAARRDAERARAQQISEELALREEFNGKREAILTQVKTASDARNYELAIHLGEHYEAVHDPLLDSYLYNARAAQKAEVENALRQEFEEKKETIIAQVKAAADAQDYELAIRLGQRYEAVHDPHLDNLLYVARDNLKAAREQQAAARKAAEEREKAVRAASAPVSDWSRLTKAQWKDKAVHAFGWMTMIPLSAPAARFQQVMGKPSHTQTVGNSTYWYYQCSDGTIQMEMDPTVLQMGTIQAEINNY